MWNKLDHPNILNLEGFYVDEASLSTAWIATAWMKNGNIAQYVKAMKPDQTTLLKLVRRVYPLL